ncbi:MAG TPA: metallophosphoesterase [Alkalispirochaeta sp.]|nr:metallophosphoesterase [Alkalispirochaeta sp.]
MKVVQITDVHLDSQDRIPEGLDTWGRAQWACTAAADFDPDLVVVTGDVGLHRGTLETYHEFRAVLEGLPCDYLVLPGNHDQRSLFAEAFGRRYRTSTGYPWIDRRVEVGGIVMLLLDSADARIHSQQLVWLDSVLTEEAAAARRGEGSRRLLLWTHYPAITGFHRFMDAEYPLANADELRAVLQRYSGDLELFLFCGHYHCEDVQQWHGVHQYCTPATYIQLDPTKREFSVTDEGPAVRVVDLPPLADVQSVVVYRSSGDG